jgi:hypothetical protein
MSSDSLAAFRRNSSADLKKLAEEHLQHESVSLPLLCHAFASAANNSALPSLRQSDRDALQSASTKVSTHAMIGTVAGLALGIYLATRVRASRQRMFNAFKTTDKPTHVSFADGRTEALPNLDKLVKPTPLGDFAAYFFFGAGGMFIGGETGLLTGTLSANRAISSDLESKKRIENAFRRFRADVLRRQAEELEKGTGILDMLT